MKALDNPRSCLRTTDPTARFFSPGGDVIEALTNIRRIVVVVPVHNEEDLLAQCLTALSAARTAVDVEVRCVVVLDGCTDGSAAIATRWAGIRRDNAVISVEHRNVGAARAAGFRSASPDADTRFAGGTWFATTDADSAVRQDWLTTQVRHARAGACAVAGTVTVDLGAASSGVALAYRADYHHRPGHRHVHGANLGLRADVYRDVGGFTALATGEDVDLIQRVEGAPFPVSYACDSPVATSNRRHGRAPEGFAGHLRALDTAHAVKTAVAT